MNWPQVVHEFMTGVGSLLGLWLLFAFWTNSWPFNGE